MDIFRCFVVIRFNMAKPVAFRQMVVGQLTVILLWNLIVPSSACESNLRADCLNFKRTALDEYVARPDPHYQYSYLNQSESKDYTVYFLNMTSQKWLNESVINNPIWWHHVSVVIPHKLRSIDSAFVWVGSGSNSQSLPKPTDRFLNMLVNLALETGTVVAQVQQIPNQPTVFTSDPSNQQRKEDAMIAWAWHMFLQQGGQAETLPRLPMTKAVVRTMDTVTSFVKKRSGKTINKFMVAGASKRGFTTWTTAAVDMRVVAMSPVVMDLLNLQKNLHHHFRSLGGWTLAFRDYYAANVTQDLDKPRFQGLMAVVDPWAYKARYTMPKLLITATGDEFFLPDDSHYYFRNLLEPKYIRMIPNAEHSMYGHTLELTQTLGAFWLHILTKTPLPRLEWSMVQTPRGAKISVKTSIKPDDVKVYHARTLADGRRDFRMLQMGPNHQPLIHKIMWYYSQAKRIKSHYYVAEMDKPPTNFLGFFIQLTFKGKNSTKLVLTTETSIVPDTFPFPDCHGLSCKGKLV